MRIMGTPDMLCVRYLSSFTTQLYNNCRTVTENLLKYVPLDGFFGIRILQNSTWREEKLNFSTVIVLQLYIGLTSEMFFCSVITTW